MCGGVVMKTVTLEQFKTFDPCWMETEDGRRRLEKIGNRKEEWTALDVLNLEEVGFASRLWAVLREEFIPAKILHEFACRCAERALGLANVTDQSCWNAIEAKRKWLRGEITIEELSSSEECAINSARDLSRNICLFTAKIAASCACINDAAYAAKYASWNAAAYISMNEERKTQLEELKKMLLEEKEVE